MGHGEWVSTEEQLQMEKEHEPEWEPEWIQKWWISNDEDIALHQKVMEQGYPNRWGARIPVKQRWNLELFEEKMTNYEDKEVVEWLRFGWPTGRLPSLGDPSISTGNHKGATEYPEALAKYIRKEQQHEAVMGPYQHIPKVGISPLSSRPKRGSQERRIILDLSLPVGNAVSDGMIKDNYMGLKAKLSFPKVDEFCGQDLHLGYGLYDV